MDQKHADCVGLFSETIFIVEPHHPNQQIVGQDAGLEDGGVGPKILCQNASGGHLPLAPFNPVFTGPPLAVVLVAGPGTQIHICYVTKIIVLGLCNAEKKAIKFALCYLTYGHKAARAFPARTFVCEFGLLKARFVFNLVPFLSF